VEIQEAYEILSDDQKRAAYDQFGHGAFEGAGAGPGPGQGFPGGFPGAGGQGFPGGGSEFAEELFEQLFGMGGARRRSGGMGGFEQGGQDITTTMSISFMEAVKGAQKPLTFTSVVNCGTCGGTGGKSGIKPKPCETCNGTGQVLILEMANVCVEGDYEGRISHDVDVSNVRRKGDVYSNKGSMWDV
jgi:molecular chaperone DnaJ